MKIAIIHGQNHKGSSYHIGRLVVDQIPGEHEIKEFFLPRDLNHFCVGCYRCIENDADCPWYEQKNAIISAMEAADLLVFTTPTYCMAPSAALKSLLDLTFTMWMSHRPRGSMFRKKAVVVSASAGSSTAGATKGVAQNLFYWGVPEIYRYGARVQAKNWDSVKPKIKDKITKDTAKLARKLGKNKPPRVGIKTRFIFRMMVGMQKANWSASPIEKEYWQNQGWLGKVRPWKQA
ncbi:MAG: NADPH-dependent oxidoreductase [Firmicutes bacterium HGW-Firmicutes-9]|jgi:multimeric flavodoxin WrbA|nr:MAG: NADPH-dependent oxidoreductase [Firmicutes bacterium HGW-Firmicutes-9]